MTDRIDFTKLLGFRTVGEQSAQGIDFKDETVAARLGGKVGEAGGVLARLLRKTAKDQ